MKTLALRAGLLGDMTRMEDDSLRDHAKTVSIPTDKEELGSDNAEQELTLTLLGSDEDILDQIEAAIRRIENGSYGRCKNCGEQIPKTRLDAVPYAADCVQCASQQETMTHITRTKPIINRATSAFGPRWLNVWQCFTTSGMVSGRAFDVLVGLGLKTNALLPLRRSGLE